MPTTLSNAPHYVLRVGGLKFGLRLFQTPQSGGSASIDKGQLYLPLQSLPFFLNKEG